MTENQKENCGFTVVEVVAVIVALVILSLVGFKILNRNRVSDTQNNSQSKDVQWMRTEQGWVSSGTPPPCPSSISLPIPSNEVDQISAVLFPGQYRGGNYKPHGGFRFDTKSNNNVQITVPMDGQVVRGSYYQVNGEPQYTFDIIAPCGLMFRLGHLRTLSPSFQKIADKFPKNSEGDSRTTNVEPAVAVKANEVVATAVGLLNERNVFFDFGVYDLRKQNAISKKPEWVRMHPMPELEWHATCWLNQLPADYKSKINSLPSGDAISGKISDLCETGAGNTLTNSVGTPQNVPQR